MFFEKFRRCFMNTELFEEIFRKFNLQSDGRKAANGNDKNYSKALITRTLGKGVHGSSDTGFFVCSINIEDHHYELNVCRRCKTLLDLEKNSVGK